MHTAANLDSPPEPHISFKNPASETQEDLRILNAVLTGSSKAFARLYQRWSRTVRQAISRVFFKAGLQPDEARLQDFVQDVWTHIIHRDYHVLRAYQPELGPPRAYIATVTTRKTFDILRKTKAVTLTSKELTPETDDAVDHRPVACLRARQLLDHLWSTLPPKGQSVLRKFFIDGCSVQDTAQDLGVTPRSVYNWCHRIRLEARRIRDEVDQSPRYASNIRSFAS